MIDVPHTHYARTPDELAIAYQVVGDGSRDILLYPTSGCVEVIWEEPSYAHVLSRLARLGRVILFDGLGVGASDPLPGGAVPTPEEWMEGASVVLDTVGSTTTSMIAIGSSGYLGMLFAAIHPERTDAVILIDTFARTQRADGPTPEQAAANAEAALQVWGTGVAARFVAPSRADDKRFRRWYARFERETMSPSTLRAVYRWAQDFDVSGFLPAIHVPTLVLHHQEGQYTLGDGRYLADHIPGARLKVFPGPDMFPFNEGVDAVVDDIEEFITGVPPVREPDRALTTVLFTDIVSSTERAAAVGDKKWRQVLDQHDALVSRELDRHSGRKVNPTGDGMLASFDGPARAVRCAQAICAAVQPLGIEVRAGLHTGEVELRANDIGGIAVHIAARVMAQAGPGEVVVSSTVRDLVAGSGIVFTDRGTHALKGVPDEWRLFAVES